MTKQKPPDESRSKASSGGATINSEAVTWHSNKLRWESGHRDRETMAPWPFPWRLLAMQVFHFQRKNPTSHSQFRLGWGVFSPNLWILQPNFMPRYDEFLLVPSRIDRFVPSKTWFVIVCHSSSIFLAKSYPTHLVTWFHFFFGTKLSARNQNKSQIQKHTLSRSF